jgi:hypothetical protein
MSENYKETKTRLGPMRTVDIPDDLGLLFDNWNAAVRAHQDTVTDFEEFIEDAIVKLAIHKKIVERLEQIVNTTTLYEAEEIPPITEGD